MNLKIGIGFFSAMVFSLSVVAGSEGVSTQYKGGFYDMAGYLNKTAVVGSDQPRNAPISIKGGPFDMNGYLKLTAFSTVSTLGDNKSVQVAAINMHANPNLLFVPGALNHHL
ncbi:hypothetical protein [Neptuniibacter sp. 2_MG-2023]|uniref:hypothetical protein n=1 Tax=Neptuniibacter sp. 2_MG-2023 TaxID=3062671 RepID=UPI0026E48426|nr:hypothetical protein [Neptuniibacter sp. 2_MG-2023]MDO6514579.1 hypothetical protein [Neptuniibacter sp. 2_MG-2023]